jgi:hypothetical protein
MKNSKKFSWRTFTSECDDLYKLNKLIFKKQQNSISMIEGCSSGLQTSNILLDTHFPGSTSLSQIHQSTSSQVDMNKTSPDTSVVKKVEKTWLELTWIFQTYSQPELSCP